MGNHQTYPPRKKRRHTLPMPWMRRFAKIWSRSQSHLAIAREWLGLAWALIGGPKGFAPLLNNSAMQKQMRWMLRLSEAVLRLAITERAKMIAVPPLTSARRCVGGALPPLDRPIAPYVARFRLDAPDDRWAIRPPNTATLAHFQQKCSRGFVSENAQIQTSIASSGKSGPDFPDDAITRKPRQPIALLFRLMACQDGLDRFEILARKEARRWRRQGGGNCNGGGNPPEEEQSAESKRFWRSEPRQAKTPKRGSDPRGQTLGPWPILLSPARIAARPHYPAAM